MRSDNTAHGELRQHRSVSEMRTDLTHSDVYEHQDLMPPDSAYCSSQRTPKCLRNEQGFDTLRHLKKPRSDGRQIPPPKVVHFVPLGALSGPGAPDPDLAILSSIPLHQLLIKNDGNSWRFQHILQISSNSPRIINGR